MPRVEIRQVETTDLDACVAVEHVSFPAAEAASREKIRKRIRTFANGFLVAENGGLIVGLTMCGATSQDDIADEELKDMVGHDPEGKNLVIFSIAVAPEHRGQGVSTRLMEALIARSRELRKERILLLCKSDLIVYYQRYGFVDRGLSASNHGGVAWHEAALEL